MKVLVIGSGGREHALVWKIVQDSSNPTIFCAPGNAGTAQHGTNIDIGAEDIDTLLTWARENKPDLTVVGPEAPLCAGIVNRFEADGFRVFGPDQMAAKLEGSKAFAKDVMTAAGVPTATSTTFINPDDAHEYFQTMDGPCVVKADGLAAGKGVIICKNAREASDAVDAMLIDKQFRRFRKQCDRRRIPGRRRSIHPGPGRW